MPLEVRPIVEDEFAEFRGIDRLVFGDPEPAGGDAADREVFDISRTRAAFIDGRMIATLGAFTFDLAVPGGRVPVGGTTVVAVLPTYRRRGALKAMMRSHLDEVRGRGEPMAALWASEGGIYGRFGFGMATEGQRLRMDGRQLRWRDASAGANRDDVRVELMLDREQALSHLPGVFEIAMTQRPGLYSRSDSWWRNFTLLDDANRRSGGSALRFLVAHGRDGAEGFATYRQHTEGFSESKINVTEVISTTPAAHAGLWHTLTNIDLFPQVEYWCASLDDPLPWLVADRFRIRQAIIDGLWLRPLDIPALLTARQYLRDDALVFDVRDPVYPDLAGRYSVEVSNGVAACERTSSAADATIDVSGLGSLYLGGQPAASLRAGGQLECDLAAMRRIDQLFGWHTAPWCSQVF